MSSKKTKTYAAKKFKSLLLVATLSMLIEYLVLLSDSIIVGNILGEAGLNAVTLAAPAFSLLAFFSMLISMGASVCNSYEVGRGCRQAANYYVSQAMLVAVVAGIAIMLGYFAWGDDYFAWLAMSSEVGVYTDEYFYYLCYLPLPMLLNYLLYAIILAEGGENYCTAASVVQLAVNIILSFVLCKLMGIGGVSLASVISMLASLAVLSIYFRNKNNQLQLSWHWSWTKLYNILRYSICDASLYLYLSIVEAILNVYLLSKFGDNAITVFAVIFNLQAFLICIFDGVGEAILPLINIYRGENNLQGIKKLMQTALYAAVLEGAAVMVLLFAAAPLVPAVFGLESPAAVADAITGVRIYAFAGITLSLIMLYTSYYVYIERVKLAVGIMGLNMLVNTLAFGILFGELFGLSGVWLGFVTASLATILLSAIYLKYKYPAVIFPLLLDKAEFAAQVSFDIPETTTAVMGLVDSVENVLINQKVEKQKRYWIMLMIEENLTGMVSKGVGETGIIECTVIFAADITLILRYSCHDNPAISLENSLDKLQQEASAKLVNDYPRSSLVIAAGDNRQIFHF